MRDVALVEGANEVDRARHVYTLSPCKGIATELIPVLGVMPLGGDEVDEILISRLQ